MRASVRRRRSKRTAPERQGWRRSIHEQKTESWKPTSWKSTVDTWVVSSKNSPRRRRKGNCLKRLAKNYLAGGSFITSGLIHRYVVYAPLIKRDNELWSNSYFKFLYNVILLIDSFFNQDMITPKILLYGVYASYKTRIWPRFIKLHVIPNEISMMDI